MDLLKRVEIALDTIRPYLETDGGNVSIEEITSENIVRLRLLGSCGSCPMSIMTLKAGIEQAIKRAVPEIMGVEAVNLTDIDDPAATAEISFDAARSLGPVRLGASAFVGVRDYPDYRLGPITVVDGREDDRFGRCFHPL